MWCDARRAARDLAYAAADSGSTFATVIVNKLAILIDGFAGVEFVPDITAVEAGLKSKFEVGSAGYFKCEGELGGVRVYTELVVKSGHCAAFVLNDIGVTLYRDSVYDRHYFLPFGLRLRLWLYFIRDGPVFSRLNLAFSFGLISDEVLGVLLDTRFDGRHAG